HRRPTTAGWRARTPRSRRVGGPLRPCPGPLQRSPRESSGKVHGSTGGTLHCPADRAARSILLAVWSTSRVDRALRLDHASRRNPRSTSKGDSATPRDERHQERTTSPSTTGAPHYMSIDTTAAPTTPQVAVNDIGSEEDFLAAIDQTIKYFNDGDIVEGTIVKVDRDEVLLDIGYKTEGVIPSRELSIKHDVDPAEVVSVGERVEALVLQKEDKEGRLILSKKRAQYERAWGTIEALKEADEPVEGTVIEVVKGGLILDIGLRGFLPASLVEMRRVRDLQPYV